MTQLESLRALYDAVKAGDNDQADAVSRAMASEARDAGRYEPLSPLTIEKIVRRGSLDSALALHNAVLPEWGWSRHYDGEMEVWKHGVMNTKWGRSSNPDPARALLLAILAEMIEREGEG